MNATAIDIFDAIFAADSAADMACDMTAAADERVRLCARALRRCLHTGRGVARAERRVAAQHAEACRCAAAQSAAMRKVHALRTTAGCYQLD